MLAAVSSNATARKKPFFMRHLLWWLQAEWPTDEDARRKMLKTEAQRALAIVAVIVPLTYSPFADAAELVGKVVRVAEGDTVTVLDGHHEQHKIRLSGIDAPELKQAFGRVSKRHLSDLVAGKHVLVEWYKQDRYGRIVGKVLIDGQDVNLQQIEAGMAWHFKRYEMEQPLEDRIAYATAEKKAREEHTGLWREPDPVPPWQYRKRISRATAVADGFISP